jgi:O-antigen/teichoic acid export membrane protein
MIMQISRNALDDARITFQSALFVTCIIYTIISVIGFVSIKFLPISPIKESGLERTDFEYLLILLFVYGLVSLASSLPRASLRATGNYALGTTALALCALTEALAACALIISGRGLITVAISYLAIRIAFLIVLIVMSRRRAPELEYGFKLVSLREVRALVPPSLAMMVLPLAQAIFIQGSAIIVGIAISTTAVASFVAVRTLTRSGVQLTTIVNHAIMPEMSGAAGRNDSKLITKFVTITIASSLIVLVPLSLFLILYGVEFIKLWTRNSIQVDQLFVVVMVASMLINGIWHPLSNMLLALNLHSRYSYMFVVVASVAMIISYPLALFADKTGVAIAILLMDAFMMFHVGKLIRNLCKYGC